MSLFTVCGECGTQFRKYAMKHTPRLCFECKRSKRNAVKHKEITVPQVLEEGKNIIKGAKKVEALLDKVNEDYISSLIDTRLNLMVEERFDKTKKLVATLNTRIIALTKRIEELEE